MSAIKASEIILKNTIEEGHPAILVGVELKDSGGNVVGIFYPKYRDLFQLIKWKFKKENKRYPQSEGYKGWKMLLSAFREIGQGTSIPKILRETKTPLPRGETKHKELPERWIND